MTVTLEKWHRRYIPAVAEYANNEKLARNLRDGFPQPYTLTDADQYVSNCIKKGDTEQLCRAVLVDGSFAGSIGVFLRENGSAELGYWLAEPFWGCGITTEATKQLCAEAFARFEITRIFAVPYEDNSPSRRVLEKAGFQLEGPAETCGCSRGP